MNIPLLARCVLATKNKNAGQLLYRIHFWMSKATVEHHGRKFVANSAEQWCAQTGLSYDQYRRAIARLRKLGFVETEQHLFGRKNVTHVRITALGFEAIETASHVVSKNAPVVASNTAPPGPSNSAQLHIHGVSDLEVLNGASTATFANAHVAHGDNGKKKKEKVSGKIKIKKKKKLIPIEEETASKFVGPIPNLDPANAPDATKEGFGVVKLPEITTRTAAAEYWKKLVTEKCNSYEAPATTKQLNQFAAVMKACPPGMVQVVLETCIREWDAFTRHSKFASAAFGIPDEPRIEFLLRYVSDAVTFTLKELKSQDNKNKLIQAAKVETIKPNPSFPVAKVAMYTPVKEEKPTVEEVKKILLGHDDE